jgi:multidrug transporter EmrE-like cation transporter
MASFHLAFGLLRVAPESYFVLDEQISVPRMFGFGLLAVAIVLIADKN